MAGLIDIASSGIQAYRKALAVTGQNIANIDTEGYRRREVNLNEVTARQSDLTTIIDQTGLGVKVDDVARAFDEFIATRARAASSDFSQAEANQASMKSLEGTILPDEYDITYFLSDMFDGLNNIAQAPADMSARVVALSQGTALANVFNQTAQGLERLKDEIFSQAEMATTEINSILTSLQNTQRQVVSTANSKSGANSILDARDQTFAELSKWVANTVEMSGNGVAKVTLGASGNGPILGTVTDAGSLAIERDDNRLIVLAGINTEKTETQEVTSGRLAGLMAAYSAVSDTIGQLDSMAKRLAEEFNKVHAEGLSLDGAAGGKMFSADSWSLIPTNSNLGDFTTVISPDKTIPEGAGSIDFIFDGKTNEWVGTQQDGTTVRHPRNVIAIDGVSVTISGSPADGDSFVLSPSIGKAENMRFLLTRPEELAAAALVMANADASNQSSTLIEVLGRAPIVSSDLPDIKDVLTRDYATLGGQRMLDNGSVGIIPAGSSDIDIASLTRQNQISFSVNDADMKEATAVSLTVDGTVYEFSWEGTGSGALYPNASSMEDLALSLNTGALRTADGTKLADLGMYAAGAANNLTIAAKGPETITEGTIASAIGTATPAINDPSQIQIFTREGRHIAGTALSQTEVLRYLNEGNGFLPNSEYRADYLNTSYRGLDISRQSATGGSTLMVSGVGFGPYQTASDTLPMRSSEGGTLTLTWETGDPASPEPESAGFDVPQGAMAGYIAELINGQTSDSGLHADANTRVMMSGLQDGSVSFNLTGANDVPVTFSAEVKNGSLFNLAKAINGRSGETGFTASLSSDGNRLIFDSEAGDDLALSDIVATSSFQIGAVDKTGTLRDGTLEVGGDSTAVRIGGEITLTSALEFSADFDGTSRESTEDAFTDGLMARKIDGAGSWQEINFSLTESLDSSEAAADGTAAAVGNTTLSLTVAGKTATVVTTGMDDVSSPAIAAAFAKKLRAEGTTVELTGKAVTSVPPDGSALKIILGSESYKLTMDQGKIVVSGPEENRISAYFDSDNKLRIAAPDGTLSGQALQLSADTSADEANSFGLDSSLTRSINGHAYTVPADGTTQTLNVAVDGVEAEITLTFDATANDAGFTVTGLPSGVSVTAIENGDGAKQMRLSFTGDPATSLRLLPGADEDALGLFTADAQLTMSETGLRATSVSGDTLNIGGSALSSTGDRLHISGTPREDLIVLVTGTGARRVTANVATPKPLEEELPALAIRVMDSASGRVELFDQKSGSSVATRYVDENGIISAANFNIRLNGALVNGDTFTIQSNKDGMGDASNMLKLIKLQARDQVSGEGGFAEEFGAIVTDVGTKARTANLVASDTEARRDAAFEQESEYSGVNLDTEAAHLLEQQQAYQALARVLQTANQLMDTLLSAMA